jgi:cephalosporin-C deacetylase-like acetyl esterase
MERIFKFVLVVLLLSSLGVNGQDELNVLKDKWVYYTDLENSLYKVLADRSFTLLEQRANRVAEIKDPVAFSSYQQQLKLTLNEVMGTFPEKTPLKPLVTRKVVMDFYTMEHVVFQSQPGFYVTSTLYLSKKLKAKTPAILFCSGHNVSGYRSEKYQNLILNFVKKGFIVYAFDPIGQGERLQYYNPADNSSTVGSPTRQHSYPGLQALISGSSIANYMVWDGIRAVDYLLSRKEVDARRIGIYGRSGGGTQSALISLFDDRISTVVSENYITNYKHLLLNAGPQDAEQNLTASLKNQLDHPDLLLARAPKPTMLVFTSRDMFNIHGAMQTFNEVKSYYGLINKSENFVFTVDDTTHATTAKNRIAIYKFLQKNLKISGDTLDRQFKLPALKDLTVSPTGQVGSSFHSETIFSLNKKDATRKSELMYDNWASADLKLMADSIKKMVGLEVPTAVNEPVFTGAYSLPKYKIEKYFLESANGHVMPYLIHRPKVHTERAVLYLNPKGKVQKEEIERLVDDGNLVLSADLLGYGELGPGRFKGDSYMDGISLNTWFLSMLNGKSILAYHAEDIVALANILTNDESVKRVSAWAKSEYGPALLHAAAFTKQIENVVLEKTLISYESIALNEKYNVNHAFGCIPNALNFYDLPLLYNYLTDRKVLIVNPVNEHGELASVAGAKPFDYINSRFTSGNGGSINISTNAGGVLDTVIKFLANPGM